MFYLHSLGLYDPTALLQTARLEEVPLAPQVLLMLLLAASCHYGCDEQGMPVPDSAKHPDARALVEGLALVLRHMGTETATVRGCLWFFNQPRRLLLGAAGAGCAVCAHAAAGVHGDRGEPQEHREHGPGLPAASGDAGSDVGTPWW